LKMKVDEPSRGDIKEEDIVDAEYWEEKK
jgi:hypothetical protein